MWSPDGSRLAFLRSDGRVLSRVVARIGGPIRTFTLASVLGLGGLVWSPDGRTIFGGGILRGLSNNHQQDLLQPVPTGSYGYGLVGFDLVTGKRRTLVGITTAVLSPDGTRIAYSAGGECRDRGGIYAFFEGNTLYGGPGNDRLVGGFSRDTLYGGPGDDVILGGAGADILVAGPRQDHLYGQGGGDIIGARMGNATGSAAARTATERPAATPSTDQRCPLPVRLGSVTLSVSMGSLFQAVTPDRMLGRTTASRRFAILVKGRRKVRQFRASKSAPPIGLSWSAGQAESRSDGA